MNGFRLYDTEKNRYKRSIMYRMDCEGKVFLGDSDVQETDVIIEQCTGLTDKNGKLFYAGDVVKTVRGEIGIVQWIPARCGFLVYFPDNSCCLVHETQEIIGNIHEQEVTE